jgi:hypothetical protein
MRETDLYLPIKSFLESQNYEVKGEVKNCDVLAVRENEEPVIIELKLSLNLNVILQAVERLSLSSVVYIGIPRQYKMMKKKRRDVVKLIKMLGLGLILIDVERKVGNIDILVDPTEYKPRISKTRKERLLGEFMKRVGDPNLGGSDKRKGVMTAYRQQALSIAKYLNEHGASKASLIAKELHEAKARNILYRNVYGWFERLSLGIYNLSDKGRKELSVWVEDNS